MQPVGPLVSKCRTLDQARAVVTFLDAASEKSLRSTVALTAARGRGKSAALGLAVAGAVGLGYSNIFVTAPSPENLRTLFEFIVQVPAAKTPPPRPVTCVLQAADSCIRNTLCASGTICASVRLCASVRVLYIRKGSVHP